MTLEDTQDALESLLWLEENAIEAGRQEGLTDGQAEGEIEGYQMGYDKGYLIGTELGFYLHHATVWLNDPAQRSKHASGLLEAIQAFPKTNDETVDMELELRRIRVKWRLARTTAKSTVSFGEPTHVTAIQM